MSVRKALARLLIFSVLEFGALCGVPMSPEQIEKVMNVMTRTKIVHVIKKHDP
jgi:ribosomal protein L19E